MIEKVNQKHKTKIKGKKKQFQSSEQLLLKNFSIRHREIDHYLKKNQQSSFFKLVNVANSCLRIQFHAWKETIPQHLDTNQEQKVLISVTRIKIRITFLAFERKEAHSYLCSQGGKERSMQRRKKTDARVQMVSLPMG